MQLHQVPDLQSLKTVVMTDVAGFTEIMRTNEPRTLPLLRDDIEVIRVHVKRNGGEVVKVAGDGVLALFSSAPRAVRACIDAQEALSESTLKHRMAVHAGEITEAEGDAYGDAINVCSRLEMITTPGTVSASRIVIDLIEAQGLPDPIRRGKVQLKGIDNPVEVFSWGSIPRRQRYSKPLIFLAAAILVMALASVAIAWKVNSSRPKSQPPTASLSPDRAANNETVEAQTVDDLLDQAFNDIWQEIDEYEERKIEAVKKVDASIVIDWLQSNPLGKRERGQREVEHWALVEMAISRGKKIAGPKADAEQIWNCLQKLHDPELDLAMKAFAEEFRRPK